MNAAQVTTIITTLITTLGLVAVGFISYLGATQAARAANEASKASMLGAENRDKLVDVGTKVDGQLAKLLALTAKSSHAEGVKDEIEREK